VAPGKIPQENTTVTTRGTIGDGGAELAADISYYRAATGDEEATEISGSIDYVQEKTADGTKGFSSGTLAFTSSGETSNISYDMTVEQSGAAAEVNAPEFLPAAGISTSDEAGLFAALGEIDQEEFSHSPATTRTLGPSCSCLCELMGTEYLSAVSLGRDYAAVSVLREITFSLRQGEVLGLFGPNGSGKSTLLNILALADRPSVGGLRIDGDDAAHKAVKLRRKIGYVPQDVALFEELTVKDNLLCWSRLPGREAKRKALELAEVLCLKTLLSKQVGALSGGMKRRVNLAVCAYF
jgi:ABC-type multidrug transport system fused ATPase/permease subunit